MKWEFTRDAELIKSNVQVIHKKKSFIIFIVFFFFKVNKERHQKDTLTFDVLVPSI